MRTNYLKSVSLVFLLSFFFLTLFVYNVYAKVNEWEPITSLTTERTLLEVAQVGEKIFLIGGKNDSGKLSLVEQYDPITREWTTKQSMISPKSDFTSVVINDKIYVFGGTETEEYDSSSDTWTSKAPVPITLLSPSSAVVNGKIYLFSEKKVLEYDPATNAWNFKNDTSFDKSYSEAVTLNGDIYIMGGYLIGDWGRETASKEVRIYKPSTDSWSSAKQMQIERAHFSAEIINGAIYVFGGQPRQGSHGTNHVEQYDPVSNTWSTKKYIPSYYSRHGHASASFKGKAFVFGGQDYSEYATDSYTYTAFESEQRPNPPTNTLVTLENDNVHIRWTPVPAATFYTVLRSKEAEGPYSFVGSVTSITYGSSVTSATYGTIDTGPFDHALYYYAVVAGNSEGESDRSNIASIILPPEINKVIPTTDGINIYWTNIKGASEFRLKRALTLGGPYETVRIVPYHPSLEEYSWLDTTAESGVTYYYVLSTLTIAGESPNSAEKSITTQPTIPTNLTAYTGSDQVILSWTGPSGASAYNVKRATTTGGPYTAIASGHIGTIFTDTNLQHGATYYYVVTAIVNSKESSNSNEVSGNIPIPGMAGGIVKITLDSGETLSYNLENEQFNNFVNWFEAKGNGVGPNSFGIERGPGGSFSSRKHFILFDRIISLEANSFKLQQ